MAEGEDWDMWASIIHSICLTSKTPLTMFELSRDVRQLEGGDIPFRKFNFRSLEDMIRNIPSMKVSNQGGRLVAQANATADTEHILKLVQKQKTKKRKRNAAPRASYRYNKVQVSYPRSGYNRSNYSQNNYVPNRPTGHHSSPQQSSYNNRSQQQYNGEHYRKTTTSPVTMQSTSSRQASTPTTPKTVSFAPTPPPTPQQKSAPTTPSFSMPPVQQRMSQIKTEQTPSQQQRISQPTQQQRMSPTASPQTQSARSTQMSFTPPATTTAQQPTVQQRFSTPAPVVPPTSNIQERLNVQKPRAALHPVNDPRLILNSYVQARNLLPPIYKGVPSKDKNIYSSVTVNSKKYSSYPREAKTKDDAEKLAAQAALEQLLDKSNMPQKLTEDRSLIKERIEGIVNSHPNGLFESSLVANYVAKYNEGLPTNWLKLVEKKIIIDIGPNNLTILSPQQDGISQQSRPPTPTVNNEPPMLDLSNLIEFWFKVYVAYSTVDVWGVIISETHSDKISDLANDMEHFYKTNEATPTAIIPGQYYAVLDSQWHRVRCIKVDEDAKKVTVFFIDRGDEDVFDLSDLRDLSVKFYTLPAQAIQISLSGLESFADSVEMGELLDETIVDSDVFVIVDTNRPDGAPLIAHCHTQKEDKTIVDVNKELIKNFMAHYADPRVFMKTNKAVCEVYISEIRAKEIYVQVKSMGLTLLNELLDDVVKNHLEGKLIKPAGRVEILKKLYLVKTDGKWRRIKLLKDLNDKALAMCIDEGSIIEVEKDTLVAIEDLSDTLAMIPPQATQINLHKISPLMFDEKMAAHLRSLAPRDDVFYMKVVGDREAVPRVELYKRTENNYLASLNDTLALEPEISSKTDDNNNDKAKSRLRNDRKSLTTRTQFPLKTPKIPIGDYVDVIVTMAAHPGNFTIQPMETANELKKLMSDLAKACEVYNGPPLTSSNVKVGNMYAAKYDNDGRWYRAYVSKILGKNICAVYFCDYGDYRAVSLDQLQPLADDFYDLPYQAIKAKLHGIVPKLKGDWTVKDSLRFNELVVGKPFVSKVKTYDINNVTVGETIVGLELIDTSTEDDVYIDQKLIDEKRAERVETQ